MKQLVLMFTLVSATSFADSDPRPQPSVLPADGAVNVPLNASLRTTDSRANVDRIRRSDTGAEVQFERRRDGAVTSFTPSERLAPNTEYTVEFSDLRPQRFTTGSNEDADAPVLPTLDIETLKFDQWRLNFDDELEPSVVVLLRRGDDVIGAVSSIDRFTASAGGNFTPPEGESFDLGVQLMDLAGNVSEISVVRDVKARPAGCSSAPAGSLLMLVAVFLRRRRSSKS